MVETISEGYEIPFFENSRAIFIKNNKSALNNSEFVSSFIQELICTERAAEVPFIRKAVSPFSVCWNKIGKTSDP